MDALGAFSLLSLANSSSDKMHAFSLSGYKTCKYGVTTDADQYTSNQKINTFVVFTYNIGPSTDYVKSVISTTANIDLIGHTHYPIEFRKNYDPGGSIAYQCVMGVQVNESSINISISYSCTGSSSYPDTSQIHYIIMGICLFD